MRYWVADQIILNQFDPTNTECRTFHKIHFWFSSFHDVYSLLLCHCGPAPLLCIFDSIYHEVPADLFLHRQKANTSSVSLLYIQYLPSVHIYKFHL